MDIYNKFAKIYDELMNDFDYEKWFNYIEEIFEKYDKLPKEILEMACGTGNLSYYLAENMYKLTAFDLSEEMLSKAYGKVGRYKNVKILKQNMVDFKFNKKFDSVISICDSINYILDSEDLIDTFKNVYKHLEDGGIFIFDINSFYKLENILGNNIFIEDREDIFYSWENFFDANSNICDFYLTFFLKEGDRYKRFDENHRERAYKTDEILEALEIAGFKTNHMYDCFTFDRPKKDTERINCISIK
ncbi:MAG: class I SAM-dependent DNA methyltransferase [Tissierella sp.]|uniref:class I SAM-dependent DNA methyltransferase n=1 Tax=Tissierella sp. TaxID=41274 RepID=UPI003F9A90ED